MAIEVCKSSHRSLVCSGPGLCHHLWCERAQELIMTELFNPDRPKSLARRVAAHPDATDEDVSRWVALLGSSLWSETRRALLRDRELQQRVDMWIKDSPHRSCLQEILDDALGADAQLLASLGPTTIDAWAEAFAADAVQWATEFPDCDRVLRHLGRDDTEHPLDRLGSSDVIRAHQTVLRVERAFTDYDEAACSRCGGHPALDPSERVAAAQVVLDDLPSDMVDRLVQSGSVTTGDGTEDVAVVPHRAGLVLLLADPPPGLTRDDAHRRPPWFRRFVLEPRRHFLEGRPSGTHIERVAEPAAEDEPNSSTDTGSTDDTGTDGDD